ncbi:MAG: hypothetical protein V3V99_08840 [candidate division Zixibacteria bacterium]
MRKPGFYVGIDVGAKELWAATNGRKPRPFVGTQFVPKTISRYSGFYIGVY